MLKRFELLNLELNQIFRFYSTHRLFYSGRYCINVFCFTFYLFWFGIQESWTLIGKFSNLVPLHLDLIEICFAFFEFFLENINRLLYVSFYTLKTLFLLVVCSLEGVTQSLTLRNSFFQLLWDFRGLFVHIWRYIFILILKKEKIWISYEI